MLSKDETHHERFLARVSELRSDAHFSDVLIQAEDSQFPAHRIMLAASSPYFLAMFTSNLEESKQRLVTIQNIPANVMKLLLDYCYTSTIDITQDNIQDVLPAASLLQLTWVKEACCSFMKDQLDSSNCLGITAFADTHCCLDLQAEADKYTREHFTQVAETREFLDLSAEDVAKLIAHENLNVRNEEEVFEAAMKWVRHDTVNRKQHLAQILQHVRMPLLNRSYLVSRVGAEPLIRLDAACRDLVDEAKDFLLLSNHRSSIAATLEGPRVRPRKPLRKEEVLIAIGGWCSGDAISMVERYDARADEWKAMASMSKRRCGVGVAVLDDCVYAIGGHDGGNYLSSVERYDPAANKWSLNVAPISTCRTSVGVGVLNSYIYIVGGQDGVSCLNIAERYDPVTNQWKVIHPMISKRLGVAVAVVNGSIYAIGGSDGSSPLTTVERYDPKLDRWTEVAPMHTRRKHLGAAVIDNLVYVVGGRDERSELSSAERYDPVTDSWETITAMNCRRSGIGLGVVNGKLYSVGGFDGSMYLKTVECFDLLLKQWKPVGSMNYQRLGCGVGVMTLTTTNSTTTI